MKIYFVTSNKHKLKEVEKILGFKLAHIDLDLDEIQAIDVEKVVEYKARQAFEKIKKPVLVEDTGLYFQEWGGLPGALVKWFHKGMGYENLCRLLKNNRKAKARAVVTYFDGKNLKHFVGEVAGKITKKPRGESGFGWDPIFIPRGHTKTFAQMTAQEKNEVSMRKIAWEKFRKYKRDYYEKTGR